MSNKLPGFYDPKNAGAIDYNVDMNRILKEVPKYRKKHSIKPSRNDKRVITLLAIDEQRDFCLPNGSLYIPGAEEDNRRIAEFIYNNSGVISRIIPTMDTHFPYQIFYPEFFLDENGDHPNSFTTITAQDILDGKYMANPVMGNQARLTKYALNYCKNLKSKGKYGLMIWPHHCMVGSIGHNFAPIFYEAITFHSFLRNCDNSPVFKGGDKRTEHYSIFQPEVPTKTSRKNIELIETLINSDMVVITGQAKSHCLAWSIQDFLDEIMLKNPDLVKKVYLLEDCTSSVASFEAQGEEAFQKFSDAGMHIVKSTDPIDQWPKGV